MKTEASGRTCGRRDQTDICWPPSRLFCYHAVWTKRIGCSASDGVRFSGTPPTRARIPRTMFRSPCRLAVVVARRGRTLTGEALQNAPAETSLRHSRNGQSIVYHATPGGHARHSPRARKLRPKRDDLKQLLGPAEVIE
jgi:hypothetical protein